MGYNLLGCLPAPTFYGMISSLAGGGKTIIPMTCLLYSGVISMSLLCSGVYMKLERERKEKKNGLIGDTGTTDGMNGSPKQPKNK